MQLAPAETEPLEIELPSDVWDLLCDLALDLAEEQLEEDVVEKSG